MNDFFVFQSLGVKLTQVALERVEVQTFLLDRITKAKRECYLVVGALIHEVWRTATPTSPKLCHSTRGLGS